MSRPDFLPTLHNMDAAQLRQCIAHASGLLAHQISEEAAALVLRRTADRLEQTGSAAPGGRPKGRWAQ